MTEERSLRFYGDPVLRRKAVPVADVDGGVREQVRRMLRTMYAEEGVGLAAQQVGETCALFVVDVPVQADTDEEGAPLNPDVPMPLAAINPVLEDPSAETEVGEEGCLSFPEIRAPVTRPAEVTLRCLDEQGAPRTYRVRGLLARAVQHEKDHLDGVLLVDRMSAVKRAALSGRLKRLRRRTEREQEV